MTWNISAEFLAAIITGIIIIYSSDNSKLRTMQNMIFRVCLLVTMSSIVTNILSTVLLYYKFPKELTEIVTTLYFIFTPSIGYVFFLYIGSIVWERMFSRKKLTLYILYSVPYCIYFFVTLFNPIHEKIFYITSEYQYIRGEWIVLTYLLFYLYCLMGISIVFVSKKLYNKTLKRILMSFPLLSIVVIYIQNNISGITLTGAAASCSLLIAYLYLQNKERTKDSITGLFNKQEFMKAIQLKIQDTKKRPFALIAISLEDLKFINEQFGYDNGDELIVKISSYFKNVYDSNVLYRFSEERIVIVLDQKKNIESDISAIRSRFEGTWNIRNHGYRIKVITGVITYPDVAETLDDVVSGLDCAIETARLQKLDYLFCDSTMLQKTRRETKILKVISNSSYDDIFEVYIQPILSIEKDKFEMGEALLRMNHHKLGKVGPNEFIPILEENGLIIDVTYWILEQLCCTLQKWKVEKTDLKALAINFSYIQFLQDDLIDKMTKIMDKYGIPYSMIIIEITESTLLEDIDRMKEILNKLNKKGFKVEIDDFGTGYCNISTAIELHVEALKFDRSLVRSSEKNEDSKVIVSHLIQALKKINVKVVAEGIETIEQHRLMKSMGCDYIQGFYHAKPMPLIQARDYFS